MNFCLEVFSKGPGSYVVLMADALEAAFAFASCAIFTCHPTSPFTILALNEGPADFRGSKQSVGFQIRSDHIPPPFTRPNSAHHQYDSYNPR